VSLKTASLHLKRVNRCVNTCEFGGADTGPTCSRILEGHGTICRALGDTLALCSPMIISQDQINTLFDRIEKAFDETESWVGKEEIRVG